MRFDLWPTRKRRFAEAGLVLVVLAILEIIVFHGYFSGASIPQFDFISTYNEEAYAWWHDGSFFNPVQWLPYMWGGYPGVSDLQNSSFYLPVGLATLFGPFTLQSSAILSAVHVAFGALGVYVLARSWRLSLIPSLVGLVGWFFVTGFYSNATDIDIMRAYAWLPWIVLVTSCEWPWFRRWWAPLVGALILWQAILATYPGMLVALAYTVPLWVVGNQIVFRPKLRRYLLPLAIVGVASVAMTLLRFLPALTDRGVYGALNTDTSLFSLGSLGTILFPYDNPALLGVSQLRPLFLPAAIIAALAFIPFRNRITWVYGGVGLAAVLLGFPIWPWHDALANLPGFNLSRFRMSDFKFVALFAACMLAVYSVQSLLDRRRTPRFVPQTRIEDGIASRLWAATRRWYPVAFLLIVNVGFVIIAVHYHFSAIASFSQCALLAASSVLLCVLAATTPTAVRNTTRRRVVAALLIGAAAASGIVSAYAVPGDWMAPRKAVEAEYLGATVDSLIASRSSPRFEAQRPARTSIPTNPSPSLTINSHYGRDFYTGQTSLFGYTNLRGTQTYELIKQQAFAPGQIGADTRNFWSAAGVLIQGAPNSVPTSASVTECSRGTACGPQLISRPTLYRGSGEFDYEVTSNSIAPGTPVMMNEAWYSGWSATVCSKETCLAVPTAMGSSGQITMTIPPGTWKLRVQFHEPHQTIAWALFYGGVLAAFALAVIAFVHTRRRTARAVPQQSERN